MFKYISILITIIFLVINFNSAEAATKKKKIKNSLSHAASKKSKRKSRHFKRHHGTGPSLKAMTTDSEDSPYKEDPNNGVNPIETTK